MAVRSADLPPPPPQHLWTKSSKDARDTALRGLQSGDKLGYALCIEKSLQSAEFSGKSVLSTKEGVTNDDFMYDIGHKLRELFYNNIEPYIGKEEMSEIEDEIAHLTGDEFETYRDCRYPTHTQTPAARAKKKTAERHLKASEKIYDWHLRVIAKHAERFLPPKNPKTAR